MGLEKNYKQQFLDLGKKELPWTDGMAIFNWNTSKIDEDHFETKREEVVFGIYFFFHTNIMTHKLSLYDWYEYFTELGGIIGTITFVLNILMDNYIRHTQACNNR